MAKRGSALARAARNKIGDRNQVGMCQYESRMVAGLPSAGDFDFDDDADAVDAWKRCKEYGEVIEAKHLRSLRDIPAGTLAMYRGGSAGHGHTLLTLGNARGASTDAPTGRWGDVPLTYPETQWGMELLGFVVTYFDGTKLVAKSGLPSYLQPAKTVRSLPKPGVYEFTKTSIRTYSTLNQTVPMEERTRGPVRRRIRQIRVNKHGQVRGRVRPLVGRWYDIDPSRARRVGN